ncbi:MAG TPA: type I CRISPR-associated protein Cas7, partial [Clostridiales bacterium]|nr:type I CRISPR-associated protein Cas7 [Clostridiales bacterium]
TRELFVFKHESELGNCPAHKLFDSIKITKKDGVIAPRAYTDYVVTVNEEAIPKEVTMERMI